MTPSFHLRGDRKPLEIEIEFGTDLVGGNAEIAAQVIDDLPVHTVFMFLEIGVQVSQHAVVQR